MKDITRRRFLALAGATTAGLASNLTAASGQESPGKGRIPPGVPAPGDKQSPPRADFEVRVPAFGDIEVVSASGLNLGSFSPVVVGGPYEFGLLAEQSPTRRKLGAEVPSDRKAADVPELLEGLPGPLVPLALHALTTQSHADSDYEVGILVVSDDDAWADLPQSTYDKDIPPATLSLGRRVGNYYIRGSIHTHRLYSCINRRVKHAGLLVHKLSPRTGKKTRMLFDIHVAAWWDRRRPCFAVYESVSGFCRNVCDYPTWERIAHYVNEPVSMGVPSSLAWGVAAVIGVAAISSLTIIPGVPPPP